MKHRGMLATIEDEHQRMDRLCELNVLEQVNNVCNTTVVQEAWGRDQELMVNGWIYGLHNGLLNDLGMNVSSAEQVDSEFEKALQKMVDEI